MTVDIRLGDCLDVMKTLAPQSVQCVVTSPPYWGLRDYGVAGQIGLERDPREYVEKLVAVFREVHRVLRNDGTLWVNMGDSYVDGGRGADTGSTLHGSRQCQQESRKATNRNGVRPFGLGMKQLIMMPARLAIAMQDDGWVLRSDIVWHKPNPMPESVRDRPTKAHEYLFLFVKSRRYYYDAAAIAEPVTGDAHRRGQTGVGPKTKIPTGWATDTDRSHRELGGRFHADRMERPHSRRRLGVKNNESFQGATRDLVPLRNRRTVWKILPEAFKGAHFATFPRALVRPCLLAGTSPRACELCGAAWSPVYGEPMATGGAGSGNKKREYRQDHGGPKDSTRRQAHAVPWKPSVRAIVAYQPRCSCDLASGTGKCVVLDPFGGSGTTALVAEELGRDAVIIELNPAYAGLAEGRLAAAAPPPAPSTEVA